MRRVARGKQLPQRTARPAGPKVSEPRSQFVDPAPQRQARDGFRGYAYQAYRTILAWLRARPNEEILCEFGEDIAIVRRDALGEVSEADLEAIKHEKGTFTLTSETAIKAIDSLILHAAANPRVSLQLRVCTIADRGQERGMNWKYADGGLDLWDRIREERTPPDAWMKLLRAFLLRQRKLSQQARKFIANASHSELKDDLVARLFFDTGQQSYSEIQAQIHRDLAALPRPVTDPDEAEAVVDRLWRSVTARMAAESPKPLTRAELDDLLRRETLAEVDRRTLREILTDLSDLPRRISNQLVSRASGSVSPRLSIGGETRVWSTPPPLPDLCSPRTHIIADLRQLLGRATVLWIHGWTGSGKSTVASLLVQALPHDIVWCSLRDLHSFPLMSSIVGLADELSRLDQRRRIVVCDDLDADSLSTATTEFRRLVEMARSSHWSVVVTSQQECPSRLRSEIASSVCEFTVPCFEEGEIKDLVKAAGLIKEQDASKWAAYITAMTAGHPLLACARIAHAQQAAWRMSPDDVFKEPRPVEQVKREARKSLAASIPSDKARELVRRLSVVMGVFSRDFAIRLGSVHVQPYLDEPGSAFDCLVGPWIERVGAGRFALSPMLAGLVEADYGNGALPRYFAIAAQAWLGERVLSPTQLIHAFSSALVGRNEDLLVRLSVWLVREDQEAILRFAQYIGFISHLCVDDDRSLEKFAVHSRFIFREAQMKVAALNADWTTYTKLDRIVMELLRRARSEPLVEDLRLQHFISTCFYSSELPFSERLARALAVVRADVQGSVSERLKLVRRSRYPLSFAAVAASVTAKSSADLDCWAMALHREAPEVTRQVLKGFDAYGDSYSIMLGHVWQNAGRADSPDWEACLRAFDAVRRVGVTAGNASLVAASTRASMIVLDEFLGDPAAAIEFASGTRREGWKHPLIDLAEAMARYHAGDASQTLDCVERAEKKIADDQLLVERIFALANALRAGSKIGLKQSSEGIARLMWIAERGLRAIRRLERGTSRKESFGSVARLAFTAELAWLAHLQGDYTGATKDFEEVIRGLEGFPQQSHRLFRSLRLRVGHVVAWLSHGAFTNERLATPFSGLIANFDEPVEELLVKPGAPYPMLWATLAQYAAVARRTRESRRFVVRARAKGGQQFYLAAMQSADALFLCDLVDGRLDAAMRTGIEYARILSLGPSVLKARVPDASIATEKMDLAQLCEDNAALITRNCHESVPGLVLAPLFMSACAREEISRPDLTNWRDQLSQAFGTNDRLLQAIELLETGFRAIVDEKEEDIRSIRHLTDNPGEIDTHIRILPFVMACALNPADLRELVRYHITVFLSPTAFGGTYWTAIFCRMVAARWTAIAQRQGFRFAAPRVMTDLIVRTASPRLFTVPHCARLLLLVAQAIGASWGPGIREQLNQLSRMLNS